MALKTKFSEALTVFPAQRVRQFPMQDFCGNKYISCDRSGLLGSYVDLRNLTSLALFHRAVSNLLNEGK